MHRSSATGSSRTEAPSMLDGLADRLKSHSLLLAVQVGNILLDLRLYHYGMQLLAMLQLLYFTVGVKSHHGWTLTIWTYAVTGVRSSTLQVQEMLFKQSTLTLLLVISLGFVLFWLLTAVGVILWAVKQSQNLRGWVKAYIRIFTLACIPTEGLLLVIFSQMFYVSLSCFFDEPSKLFSRSLQLT